MQMQQIRKTLIDRTITVIAEDGLDKTTTKAITAGTGINEAYIYRCFTNKESLLSTVFDKLDEELVEKVIECAQCMSIPDMSFQDRCRACFDLLWAFLLGNREKCLSFVRYYYSPYFSRLSAGSHRQRCQIVLDRFSPAFKEEADVWMILNHILNVMLDFAVKVHHDQMPKDDDYSEHVFRVVYVSVLQYFKNAKEMVSQ